MKWTWTWTNFRRWWVTGRPGVLQSMGLQKVRHDSATEWQQLHYWFCSWGCPNLLLERFQVYSCLTLVIFVFEHFLSFGILLREGIYKVRQKYLIYEVKLLSHVRLFVAPWTVAHQAPPSMEFSRQECWSGLPLRSSHFSRESYSFFFFFNWGVVLEMKIPSSGCWVCLLLESTILNRKII